MVSPSQTPAGLASGTTPDESVFVPRLSSLLFAGTWRLPL